MPGRFHSELVWLSLKSKHEIVSMPKRNINNSKTKTITIIARKIDRTQHARNTFHALSHLIFTLNDIVLKNKKTYIC